MNQRDDYADLDLPPPIRWTEVVVQLITVLGFFAFMAGGLFLLLILLAPWIG